MRSTITTLGHSKNVSPLLYFNLKSIMTLNPNTLVMMKQPTQQHKLYHFNTIQSNPSSTSSSSSTTTLSEMPTVNSTTIPSTTTTHEKPLFTKEMVLHHYEHHHVPLAHSKFHSYGTEPYTQVAPLDSYQVKRSYEPQDLTDKFALSMMKSLRVLVHAFFGDRYLHHSVVLETVASVPGMVAAGLRHFSSLRNMRRDHGNIGVLLEEAENERMHLLTWMCLTRPTFLERLLVMGAQIGFTSFYTLAYVIHPRFCHRLVGYLEEEAVNAYTEFLEAIDKGQIPNTPAPEIALKYWNLPPGSTMRDVVLVIRGDECMHRDYNHDMSDKHRVGLLI
ncbi:hypothetical protein C9374_004149 [Naegleria lovaniensis]|uniref:Alternative oxidase n=1 Tax=Naegleria lovaniensis TaxID=51637 RepID=A0AA88KKU9_NAELO|nr:uncharacterized protein C9374_004149 [Naegleria lovaniensis]KAG2383478.1 hypothetical protein C9374_004149 [Naegleria lovaniensis]